MNKLPNVCCFCKSGTLILGLTFLFNFLAAQVNTITVSGKITSSENQQGIAGVSILEKGTHNGTTSDRNGLFHISTPKNARLQLSVIGYEPQEVAVAGSPELNVEMQPSKQQLSNVVVIGYGTQRKKDLTGSIVSLSSKDLVLGPASSFDQMMQGKVPGAQIVQTSGAPGGNVNVLIRGVSSITGGNSPLYVVDGYAIGTGGGGSDMTNFASNSYSASGSATNSVTNRINPLSTINPADIKSIEILKDASATAIYGSRGANGVVIITTKRGSAGKAVINVDISTGSQELPKKLKLLSSSQYAQFVADGRDNAWVLAGGKASDPNSVRSTATQVKPSFRDPSSVTTNTDWQDVIFRKAPVQNYQVSVSGGSDNVKYYLSGNYLNQDGIIIGSDFKKFGLRSNVDAQLSSHLKLGSSFAASYSYGDFARAEGHLQYRGLISAALASDPTIPIYDSAGNFYSEFSDPTGIPVENPLVIAQNFLDKRDFTNVFSNTYLEYKIMKGLDFRSSIGVNYTGRETRLWKSSQVGLATSRTGVATAGVTEIKSINYLNENTLHYHETFKKHEIDGLAGFSVQKNTDDILEAGASNFPTDEITYIAAGQVTSGTNYQSQWSMVSWFARVNYVFDSKYLLTATLRQDGSSRFGTNNKWGTFPSVSVGYRISDEAFMKNIKFVSDLKLRASYGIAGNNLIDNYASQGLLGIVRNVSNGQVVSGIAPSSLSNDNLTWEQSVQTNAGIDLGLFDGRISFTADVYRSLKKNLLLNVTLPAVSGFNSSVQNIGELENKGVELAVNTENIKGTNFQWNTNFNISFNRNKVLALNGGAVMITNSAYQITEVGKPISSFYLLHTTGVFQSQEEISKSPVQSPQVQPGDLKFEDVNGDGKITTADKKIVGNPWPKYIWGFNNSFTYKAFTLTVSVNASQGNKVYFEGGEINLNDAGVQNQLAVVDQRWKSASDPGNGSLPRAIRNDYAFTLSSTSRYLFDGSFVKIRDIHLSYLFPAAILNKLKVQGLSLYADVTNVYTFTKYPGYDPEGSIGGDNVTESGVDFFAYPNPRTYTLGVRFSF